MKEDDSIGNRLRKARLKLGMTFDQAYAGLKIHPRILQSLEEDRIDPNVGEIYVKGFIKKYADYLGFEGEKIANEFVNKHLPELEATKGEVVIDISGDESRFTLPAEGLLQGGLRPFLAGGAIILALSIILFGGTRLISGIIGARRQPPDAVETAKKEPEKPKKPERTRARREERRRVVAKPKKPPKPTKPALLVPLGKPLILKASTTDKVWLRVKSDGRIVFENILAKNSSSKWQAKKELELWVGRGEALTLSINGKDLGSPGSGRIRRVIIRHDGMKVQKK